MPEGFTFHEFSKCGTDAKKLVAIFNNETRARIVRLAKSDDGEGDLSGGGETQYILHTERAATLLKATLLYLEASSADAGVNVTVGKEGDADYYVTAVGTEKSKAQFYSKDLTLAATDIAAGDTVSFTNAGAKVGTGQVMLVIEYVFDD